MPAEEILALVAVGGTLLIGAAFLRWGLGRKVEPEEPTELPVAPRDAQQNRPAPQAEGVAMEGNPRGLHADIDRSADPECPLCGKNDWLIQDGSQGVNLRLDRGVTPAAIEVLFYICGDCGFVRLHSTDALKGS